MFISFRSVGLYCAGIFNNGSDESDISSVLEIVDTISDLFLIMIERHWLCYTFGRCVLTRIVCDILMCQFILVYE